ncbi:MAG: hypothetical protein EXR86_13750 [Gammaproteobacteria bacterium]|nr:hypothetical protein [Gammaproteobacteria bacterium]
MTTKTKGRNGVALTAAGEKKQRPHFAKSVSPTAQYFLERGQRFYLRAIWGITDCTVCRAVDALLVRGYGAFHCNHCGISGDDLSALSRLEEQAKQVTP